MPIQSISEETLERAQGQIKQQLAPALAPPKVLNTPNVLLLGIEQRFILANKTYVVMPVGFKLGAQLQSILIQIGEIKDMIEQSESALEVYVQLCSKAADLMWKGCMPAHPVAAIKKRLRIGGNPLQDATDGEVAQLLPFFLRHRMLSRLQTAI
jgi:hypothetical protein